MLPVKSWRIFYADGSTFSSEDGSWAEAPPFGVECVVYYHTEGKTLQAEAHDPGVYSYLGPEGYEELKLGLWMDAEGYYRILTEAGESSP